MDKSNVILSKAKDLEYIKWLLARFFTPFRMTIDCKL